MTWTTRPRSEGAGQIAYWRDGTGPALILIHGVGLRAEAWAALAPQLANRFTLYAVDMPGHGASPLGTVRALPDYVDRLHAFAKALGEPVSIAGHSMGAMIALELAARDPDLVSGVAALNAIYRRSPEAAQAVQQRAASLATQDRPSPDPTLARWFGPNPTGPDADAADACRHWLTDCDHRGYATAYGVFAHHDGPDDDRLAALSMPALFQTGAQDPNSTPQMSRDMAERAPNAAADTVQDAAHMMPMTHPQAVADALRQTFRLRT